MNDLLKGYIIFCVVLISIAAIFTFYFQNPPMRIAANGDDAKIIKEALKNTDRNVTRHISSVSVVNDWNMLSKAGCMSIDIDVGGCALIKYTPDSFDAEIYLASPELLNGTCLVFKNVVYHEIGHVVYFQQYGNKGTYQKDQEPYAVSYASQFAKDNCKR